MYKHFLIATDGSEFARQAIIHGLTLAKELSAKATIITVTEPWDAIVVGEVAVVFPPAQYEESAAANAARILRQASELAAELGTACETLHVKDRRPADGIIETAEALQCDIIVMTSHGRRGLSRLILGSTANDVVAHSKMPVLICRS